MTRLPQLLKTSIVAVISLLLSGCVVVNRPAGFGTTGHDDSNTANSLTAVNPALSTFGGAAYPGQIYNSLSREDANRWYEQGWGNQVSIIANTNACLGTTGAGLTMTPVSCIAYNAGYRGTETGPITFPNNSICWVAMDENTSGNNSGLPNFARVPSTHYLLNCIDSGQPSMVGDSQLLMKVTTMGAAITGVQDKRTTNIVLPTNISALNVTTLTVSGASNVNTITSSGLATFQQIHTALPLDPAYGGTGTTSGAVSWLTGNTGGTNMADGDVFPINGSAHDVFGNINKVVSIAPTNGTLSNLRCFVTTAPASGTWTIQVLANSGATCTPQACSIVNAATTCSDTVDTCFVAAGQRLVFRAQQTAGTITATPMSCSVELQP